METKKMLGALVLVVVLGVGAHWYLSTMKPVASTATSETDTETSSEAEMEMDLEVDIETVSAVTPSRDVVTNTQPNAEVETAIAVDPQPTISDLLLGLDQLFDDSYDDSGLDASFEDNFDESYGT